MLLWCWFLMLVVLRVSVRTTCMIWRFCWVGAGWWRSSYQSVCIQATDPEVSNIGLYISASKQIAFKISVSEFFSGLDLVATENLSVISQECVRWFCSCYFCIRFLLWSPQKVQTRCSCFVDWRIVDTSGRSRSESSTRSYVVVQELCHTDLTRKKMYARAVSYRFHGTLSRSCVSYASYLTRNI